MSNRFFGLCLTILLISNIFFLNFIINPTPLNFSEVSLGKLLNQSTHLLIFFYLILNKKIDKKDLKIILILIIISIDFINEFIVLVYPPALKLDYLDSLFVITERFLMAFLMYTIGGKLIATSLYKNLLNILFAGFFIYLFSEGFANTGKFSNLIIASFIVLFIMTILGSNTSEKLFHFIGLGVLIVALGDLAYIYSAFHGDFAWKYLYTLPRVLISLGELFIVYKVLKKQVNENLQINF